MPWNEPGNNGNNNQQDPWGSKNNSNPPDLDKIISDFIRKLRGLFFNQGNQANNSWQSSSPPPKAWGYGVGIGATVIFLLWFFSGFFIVNPAEEAVMLRFGKYNSTLQPGLHWMARFVDTKSIVDVQKVYSFLLEGNFLTKSSEQGDLPNQVQIEKKATDSPDQSKNLVNVELNVQYRISDPRAYLYNVVNPDETMQQVATSALSDVIGQMKLDKVLTTGREMLSSGVSERSKQILSQYNLGLQVVTVTLRKVQAPDQVREAFSDVNRADQDRATTIQQAQAYASKVVPLAQGAAARISADAKAYRQQVVLTAQAEVARYLPILQAYQGSPDVTRERLYLTAMQNILANSSKVLINGASSNNLIYLPLDKLMKQTISLPTNDMSFSQSQGSSAVSTMAQTSVLSNPNSNALAEVKNDTQ